MCGIYNVWGRVCYQEDYPVYFIFILNVKCFDTFARYIPSSLEAVLPEVDLAVLCLLNGCFTLTAEMTCDISNFVCMVQSASCNEGIERGRIYGLLSI